MRPFNGAILTVLAALLPGFFIAACSKPPQAAVATAASVEKGMYFKPGLRGFAVHNEYDDDGDGDGINETLVRRYINERGDTAFSMTTGDHLWAWSVDTRGDDDADIHRNYVIRDSNCDGIFDERYSLSAEFHVPGCLKVM
ncbi:MAG TPA: hypothetical protein ENJ80_10185 [Gammaproteobacteria bacterium]|nr:hypothetical protein [Gammaproteobacteria bacterium]